MLQSRVIFFLFALGLVGIMPTMAQQKAIYNKIANGIEISLANSGAQPAQQLRLTVINARIIHVEAFPAGPLNISRPELMLTDTVKAYTGAWNLLEQGDQLLLKTDSLTASVSLLNGAIAFTDHAGNTLTSEQPRSALSFTPDAYNGDSFYQIKQSFELAGDEALYGLGQHQGGQMNYRGRQVTLLQYNTEVAVPLLLSTRHYGILWHNYSITKAGDVRPLMPLSAFKLYAADGQQGWLTASYYKKDHPDSLLLHRPESDISYSYLSDLARLPQDIQLSNTLVRYEGAIESPDDGLHRLLIHYAGYLKVWVDGKLLANRWRESWNAGSFELELLLEKGKKYPIRMEWLPEGNQSYLTVKWQRPIPTDQQNVFSFQSEAGDAVDYYFIAGQQMDDVIAGYRYLTGRAPIMPRWSFGYWQSRERYKTQQEVLETAAEFRKRHIPIDNLVQDWSYWKEPDWGSQDFDSTRFPDPAGMVKKLHDEHFRLMISVWAKVNEASKVFPYFRDKGWLYGRNIAEGRKDWIGKGYTSTFYDPFNPAARKGFWQLMDNRLYKLGMDAWWMDASEPDVHSNLNIDERKSVFQPSIGSSTRYYNAFPLMNAKGIYEGQRESDPDNRVFILTRSAFAGQQRYAAATWSGDIASRWHDFKDQIAAGLNFSMSGIPYWTMDAGGFLVENRFQHPNGADLDEWREMNVRWFQYASFLPIFRAHGQFPYREPWNIAPEGDPAYQSLLYSIQLRYRLLPYNYSLGGQTYLKNYTMLRGLAMDFGQDTKVWNINDQYMFGPAFLVNPVTEKGLLSRPVYLPAGAGWYDFYKGAYFAGGQTIQAAAPYDRVPLFVKAGSIIPVGPALQYTDEKAPKEITLYVYGGADGSFTLYEDEGVNYHYEKGAYSTLSFTYQEATHKLTIGKRKGSFPGMLKDRVFRVIFVNPQQPGGIDQPGSPSKKLTYHGSQQQLIVYN
ncbi:alpha-D-xyloside xylohydrolase [bacterium A37T11]|nr:alpha-D-xyloside xylohydrolase [bacterium A37T11]